MTTLQTSQSTGEMSQEDSEDEISLLDMLIALGEEKKWVMGVAGVALVLGLAVAFFSTNKYTAKTVLMPPQQVQSSVASALASPGSLAGLAGGAVGIKSQDELYIAILKSERLQNSLIQKFVLQERYEENLLSDARKALDANVKIASDKKSGLITIEVTDEEPKFAAQLANAYVDELGKVLGSLAVSEAQQRRQFFERQVTQVKDQLVKSEINFKQAQTQSGMQVTQALAETGVRASVELRQQIVTREVLLQSLRTTYATDQNPDVIRLSREIAALRAQLSKTEKGTDGGAPNATLNNAAASAGKESVGQEAVRAYRDVKVQEAMLDVMIRQYELARVDESKEGPLLQQVDMATPPERKSAPRRVLIVLAGLTLGLLMGLLIAAVRRLLLRTQTQPEWQESRLALSKAWRMR
ncbi:MAG: Wzz/FepE/Etk N-terminal domain-containing protein [Cytophagales bacterium]|nr:Wzz/FepE/Etk N-terminal domain-containing protein [Cytophagales bacterium]